MDPVTRMIVFINANNVRCLIDVHFHPLNLLVIFHSYLITFKIFTIVSLFGY